MSNAASTKNTTAAHQPQHWMGASAAFGRAFEQVKTNPAPAALFALAYLVVTVLEATTLSDNPKDLPLFAGYEGLLYLLFLLALPVYALAIADRKTISLGEFMDFRAKKYFIVLGASILYGLIVIGSLLLLIVPAIWTIAWFAVCVLAAVDKDLGPIEALKESKRLMRNQKAKVWGIIGVTILLSILAGLISLVPVVGPLIAGLAASLVTVLSTAATALLYRWVQHHAPSED